MCTPTCNQGTMFFRKKSESEIWILPNSLELSYFCAVLKIKKSAMFTFLAHSLFQSFQTVPWPLSWIQLRIQERRPYSCAIPNFSTSKFGPFCLFFCLAVPSHHNFQVCHCPNKSIEGSITICSSRRFKMFFQRTCTLSFDIINAATFAIPSLFFSAEVFSFMVAHSFFMEFLLQCSFFHVRSVTFNILLTFLRRRVKTCKHVQERHGYF